MCSDRFRDTIRKESAVIEQRAHKTKTELHMQYDELIQKFTELYGGGEPPRLFAGPARINLIGEHIDYNGGMVFPAAVDLRSACAVRARTDGRIRLASTSTDYRVDAAIDELADKNRLPWGSYQLGVIYLMRKAGYAVPGMDMLFDETVPHGGGLSASAAIELATAVACASYSHERAGTDIDMVELAKLGRRAENEYIGMNCGIMDQFASAMGRKDSAILLDCATLEYRYAPVDFAAAGLAPVIMNTNKPHNLVVSAYNTRLVECGQALADIRTVRDIDALCELSIEQFREVEGVIRDKKCRDRAEHAVYENRRTYEAFDALNSGDMQKFGALLTASHESLKNLYEVTGKELDSIVYAALDESCCIGARMMGGGFGGCAIALVEEKSLERFMRRVGEKYKSAVGLDAAFYGVSISDGAREIRL